MRRPVAVRTATAVACNAFLIGIGTSGANRAYSQLNGLLEPIGLRECAMKARIALSMRWLRDYEQNSASTANTTPRAETAAIGLLKHACMQLCVNCFFIVDAP